MAKAHTIDDVVDHIINNYTSLLKEAVEHTAEKAKEDIHNKAVNVLYKYYYGSYEPKSYDRIEALQYAIVPFSTISTVGSKKKEKIKCTVGVEYNPDALEEYLSMLDGNPYKASKKYGVADAEWVVSNFWKGLHPDGSGEESQYHRAHTTQDQGMYLKDDTGPSLTYYQFTIFPQLVREYMIDRATKLF